ncbi:hypothetical protein [Donghicola eburneus]|uniref:hypothetical protein n=1 Tax=Donghicola eburneus TaxID=393278 RepID=UPI001160286F|nr:hypothetical protein [Donghicola eburneus]
MLNRSALRDVVPPNAKAVLYQRRGAGHSLADMKGRAVGHRGIVRVACTLAADGRDRAILIQSVMSVGLKLA